MNTSAARTQARSTRNERVLVVDDDTGVAECVSILLGRSGYRSTVCATGADALARLAAEEFQLVITDLRLPDANGLDIVSAAREMQADSPIILMTSYSSIKGAVEALRNGAHDYIIKPFDNEEFMFSVERALAERRTRSENSLLKRSLRKVFTQNTIIGQSEGIKRMLDIIRRVADNDANVLIQGESGTGKELVAQAIHFSGNRAQHPFVPVNCGAIPLDLIESELFGHARGAYTGAVGSSEGLIREAGSGTLFLDEISELPLNVQVKLLRVIQERQVRPVGSSQSFNIGTRFVAASNRRLKECAANGTFRSDLYYRLNVLTITVPPLRERADDIETLAKHFMNQYSRKLGREPFTMEPALLDFLKAYHWPGNVRELQNVIERAVILADDSTLRSSDLEDPGLAGVEASSVPAAAPMAVEDYIRDVVVRYQASHGEGELAAMLGIGRKALWMRRKTWGLQRK